MDFYQLLFIILAGSTIVYGVWNLYTLFKLDSESSRMTGEVLPSSNYIWSMVNTVSRVGFLYLIVLFLTNYESLTSLNGWLLLVLVMLIVLLTVILSTLLEAIVRTVILLVQGRKESKAEEDSENE